MVSNMRNFIHLPGLFPCIINSTFPTTISAVNIHKSKELREDSYYNDITCYYPDQINASKDHSPCKHKRNRTRYSIFNMFWTRSVIHYSFRYPIKFIMFTACPVDLQLYIQVSKQIFKIIFMVSGVLLHLHQ